jgi:hypothetical protein
VSRSGPLPPSDGPGHRSQDRSHFLRACLRRLRHFLDPRTTFSSRHRILLGHVKHLVCHVNNSSPDSCLAIFFPSYTAGIWPSVAI